MTMRLNPTYQNHLKDWVKGSIILYSILVGIYLIALITSLIVPVNLSDGTFGGMDSIPQVFLFVAGIVTFTPNLKLALANGISRKTEFTTTLLSAGTVSVIYMILNIGICLLFGTIFAYQDGFATTFPGFTFANGAQYHLLKILYDILGNFTSFIGGYFIGALYYRMSKPLKILVSVGVPVLLFVGAPIASISFLRYAWFLRLVDAVVSILTTISGNPYYTILTSVLIILILGVFSFLLIRKAPIKEQG